MIRKLLTIDGGGVRGVIVLQFLTHLEEHLGCKSCEYFDGFAGTSTGALIAVLLSSGKLWAKEILDQVYSLENIQKIFTRGYLDWILGNSQVSCKYTDIEKNLFIQKYIRMNISDNPNTSLYQLNHRVLIPAYNVITRQPILFRNYFNCPIYNLEQVCNATTAAPSYFPMVKIDGCLVTPDNPDLLNNNNIWTQSHTSSTTITATQAASQTEAQAATESTTTQAKAQTATQTAEQASQTEVQASTQASTQVTTQVTSAILQNNTFQLQSGSNYFPNLTDNCPMTCCQLPIIDSCTLVVNEPVLPVESGNVGNSDCLLFHDIGKRDIQVPSLDKSDSCLLSSGHDSVKSSCPTKNVKREKTESMWAIDGGVFANNPSELFYLDCLRLYPDSDLLLLSIGTGITKSTITLSSPSNIGGYGWLFRDDIIGLLMDGEQVATHQRMKVLADLHGHQYLRINGYLEHASLFLLDNVTLSNYQALIQIGTCWWEMYREKLTVFLKTN